MCYFKLSISSHIFAGLKAKEIFFIGFSFLTVGCRERMNFLLSLDIRLLILLALGFYEVGFALLMKSLINLPGVFCILFIFNLGQQLV